MNNPLNYSMNSGSASSNNQGGSFSTTFGSSSLTNTAALPSSLLPPPITTSSSSNPATFLSPAAMSSSATSLGAVLLSRPLPLPKLDPERPRRSKSAYLYYVEVIKSSILQEYPLANTEKVLHESSEKWKKLMDEDKVIYQKKQEDERVLYEQKYVSYRDSGEEAAWALKRSTHLQEMVIWEERKRQSELLSMQQKQIQQQVQQQIRMQQMQQTQKIQKIQEEERARQEERVQLEAILMGKDPTNALNEHLEKMSAYDGASLPINHSSYSMPPTPKFDQNGNGGEKLQCPECQKWYPHYPSLYQHRFKVHNYRAAGAPRGSAAAPLSFSSLSSTSSSSLLSSSSSKRKRSEQNMKDDDDDDEDMGIDSDDSDDDDDDDDDDDGFPSVPGASNDAFFSRGSNKKARLVHDPVIKEEDEEEEPYMQPGLHAESHVYVARENQTPLDIAKELGIDVFRFVRYNKPFLKGLQSKSKLIEQTRLKIPTL